VDAVLGLSVTPSAVGLVLVEGQDADGATVDREAFEIPRRRRSTPLQTSEQAAAAVLRTEAVAATRGHRLHSIGVTWSDDADTEASLLLRSLTESGFDNVVPVRLSEATEALAWGVAEVIGEEITAVCVIEPETVIALIVHTGEGAVQTAVNHAVDSEETLIRWLCAVFTRADWRPQALVVVGSGGEVDALMPRLEAVLSVPVFAPADSELALARGAALASARSNELTLADDAHSRRERPAPARSRWPSGQTGPLAMLVAGAVTFVVSVSVAVSLEITPRKDAAPPEPRPAAKSSPDAAAAAESVPLAPPRRAISAPPAETPLAPPPEVAPPVEAPPPPVVLPAEPPTGADDLAMAPDAAPPIDGPPPEAAPVPPVPGAPIDALPPQVPAAQPPPIEPVPAARPSIRERIRDRLSGIGRNGDDVAAVQQAPAPAAVAPPEAPAPPPAEAPPAVPPEAITAPTTETPIPPPEVPPLPPPP
jgi:hypothetical protein